VPLWQRCYCSSICCSTNCRYQHEYPVISAAGTVPLLGSLSLQCCYCTSIGYNYLTVSLVYSVGSSSHNALVLMLMDSVQLHNYSSSIVVYEDALLQHLLQYRLPLPKRCLAIYAVGTVPLLGSISLQCCYCSSICYKYLLSKPTLRLQIHRIHNSATKRKILLSMQLDHFQFLNLLHSSVATAPVSVTTTCCHYRRRDFRSWKVQHTNRRPWALLLTQHLSQSLMSLPQSKLVFSAAKNSSILWIFVPQWCYCSRSVEQPAVSFNVIVPAVSTSGSVQHIILPQTSKAVNAPA